MLAEVCLIWHTSLRVFLMGLLGPRSKTPEGCAFCFLGIPRQVKVCSRLILKWINPDDRSKDRNRQSEKRLRIWNAWVMAFKFGDGSFGRYWLFSGDNGLMRSMCLMSGKKSCRQTRP